jgi:ABC-2 type transport system ATP-binding protein
VIEVDGLTKLYRDVRAVDDLSFRVEGGQVLGLLGPNGAGKTTTLRCLVGILPPTRGTIRIGGHSLAGEAIAAKALLAFMPDEPRLFPNLTVAEHLALVARIYRVANATPTANALLEELELADKRDALPSALSRGMKQKLVIACGLVHAPRVLVFDEPLTGLDPAAIRALKSGIVRRARDGAAVVVSSHLLHLVEELCDRILVLQRGRAVLAGSTADVVARGADLEDVFLSVTNNGGSTTHAA